MTREIASSPLRKHGYQCMRVLLGRYFLGGFKRKVQRFSIALGRREVKRDSCMVADHFFADRHGDLRVLAD